MITGIPPDRRRDPARGGAPAARSRSRCRATRSASREARATRLAGEGVRRGVGFAVGFKNICYSEGFDDSCAARVELRADGSALVHCAAAEVGQGVAGVILQVARTELGTDRVELAPHTDRERRLLRLRVGVADDLDGGRRGP